MQVQPEVRDRFSADHRRLEAIATEVVAAIETRGKDQMRAAWKKLETAVNEHFQAEEVFAFPHLTAQTPRDAQALLAEHKHLRARVAELGTEIERGSIRPEMIRGFVDELSAHSRHEETILYR